MNAAFLAAAGSPASILPPRTIPRARFNPFAPLALAPPIAPPSSPPPPPPAAPPPTQHSAPSTQHFSPPRDSRLASRDSSPPSALGPAPCAVPPQHSALRTQHSATAALAHALYHRNLERIAEADLRGQPPSDETLRYLDFLRRQFVSAATIDLRERTLNVRLARDAQAAARRAGSTARTNNPARTAADRPRHGPPDDDDLFDDDATTATTRPSRARSRSRSRSRTRAPDLPILPVNPADITPPPLEDDDFLPPAPSVSTLAPSESVPIRANPSPLPSRRDSRLASRDSPVPPQHSAPGTQHFSPPRDSRLASRDFVFKDPSDTDAFRGREPPTPRDAHLIHPVFLPVRWEQPTYGF